MTFESNCRVRRLADETFYESVLLAAVCIPASVESIGKSCFALCGEMNSLTFERGSKLSMIGESAFQLCTMMGPSIQLPSSLDVVPVECFNNCVALSLIRFEPNSSLRAIGSFAFRRCQLKSLCVPASVRVIDWSCFARCPQAADITFESPCKIEEISNFDAGMTTGFPVPDSVISMTVSKGSFPGFVCSFGMNSRLRGLRGSSPILKGGGFMRVTETSLKRLRMVNEWEEM